MAPRACTRPSNRPALDPNSTQMLSRLAPHVLLLGLGADTASAQTEGVVNMQVSIPDGYFNAAYLKPVLADSTFSDHAGSCGGGDGDDCTPNLAVDGFTGDHHRWLSTSPVSMDGSPGTGPAGEYHHWLAIDLQDDFWIQQVTLVSGRDSTHDDPPGSNTHPLCSYQFDVFSGQSHAGAATTVLTADFATQVRAMDNLQFVDD